MAAAFIAATLPAPSAAQMTAPRAQSMPFKEMAQRLLGDSGSIMIDVDRPRYKNVLEPIRFYSQAIAWGSYYGICASDWVTVEFNERGFVEALRSERRYGVAGNIYTAPGRWTYDAFGSMCASVKTTKKYFPAPDHGAASDIVRYVHALSSVGPYKAQKYVYKCEGLCKPGRSELEGLRLEKITSSRAIECPNMSLKLPDCYEIVIGEGEIGPFPKTFRVYGSNYMNRTVISELRVNVSATVQ
jgi:hypothetical protein